jgi:hypothetical protein
VRKAPLIQKLKRRDNMGFYGLQDLPELWTV